MNHTASCEDLVTCAHALAAGGLLFRGHHANLSARANKGLWMTRGGQIAHLTSEDVGWVGFDGAGQENFEPTFREVVAMHSRVYGLRPDLGGLIHCHAPHLTAFAVAQQPLAITYEPLLRVGLSGDIPVVAWAPRGSKESVDGILDAFKIPATGAVLLANHGVLVAGAHLDQALARLTLLEEAAELALHAQWLGGAKHLPQTAYADVRARQDAFRSTP
ncbi:MAG: class II aldolase/adducin family protein [Acidiferrobacter sp.]